MFFFDVSVDRKYFFGVQERIQSMREKMVRALKWNNNMGRERDHFDQNLQEFDRIYKDLFKYF